MGLRKREYTDRETIITAESMNDIQDAILSLEDGLFSVDNDKSGEVITITDAAQRGFRSLNIYGKTTQNGTPTPDAPVDLVSVGNGSGIDVMVAGKNLLKTTAVSASMNGVSFTVNSNGSITANGTATVDTYFTVNESVYIGNGEYYLTGCPTGGSVKAYFLYISGLVQDFGNGVRSKLSGSYKIGICIAKDSTVSNLTFYPMIRPVSVSDGVYEPYKGQTLSIATPDGLPGIPVASGGNYTDANGQQWICDEIDFFRGVYVQRVVVQPFTNGDGWGAAFNIGDRVYNDRFRVALDEVPLAFVGMSNMHSIVENWGISDGSIGFNGSDVYVYARFPGITSKESLGELFSVTPLVIAYGKKEPIEIPLAERELADFAALYTYKDHTTVSNDAGAYMELEYVMDAKKYFDSKISVGTSNGILPATVE